MKWFFKTWRQIILGPTKFLDQLPPQDWREEPLSFFLISAWLLSFALTLMVYINKLWPVAVTLVEEINFWQKLLVSPVIVAVALVFFFIIFVLVGGAFVFSFYVLFFGLSFLFQSLLGFLKKEVGWHKLLGPIFYSSSVLLCGALIALFAIVAQLFGLPILVFKILFNLVYLLAGFYFFWLWSVILRREAKIPPSYAFLISFSAVFLLLLFQIVFNLKLFDKVSGWMI